MKTAWFRRSRVATMALLGGLVLALSGCHLIFGWHGHHHGGHGHGGHHRLHLDSEQ